MLTVTDAAALLQRATDHRGRSALLRSMGFAAPVGALDAATISRFGLTDVVQRVDVAAGDGALRGVLAEVAPSVPLREAAARVARRLAARTPEHLWFVIAAQRRGDTALVVPSPGGATASSALLISPHAVRPGDAEALCALEGARGMSDVETHLRWREVLGRDALTRRFYRDLEQGVRALAAGAHGAADAATRHTLALRCASRLLFLAFLEAKGWLDADRGFLARQVATTGGQLHRQLLEPLFFGTLNTPLARRAAAARHFGRVPFLNGGLFARDALEKRHRALRFADADVAHLVEHLLGRYRVTAHEGSSEFEEAAVDPEMLGRAFESLMASDDRRNTGAFYTPPIMIARITELALDAAVASPPLRDVLAEARMGRVGDADDARALRAALLALRVCDPACGTGAFLVHAMRELSRLLGAAHDARPEHERRRAVLSRSIFGVDINPTAVWLCELRLWLAVVVDSPERDPLRVPPLPNLDRHIRCADALAGPAFHDLTAAWEAGDRDDAALMQLRGRYTRATGARKRSLQRALDRLERTLAVQALHARLGASTRRRRDLVCALRGRDLFGGRRVASATERAALGEWRREAQGLRRALAALRAGGAVPFGFAWHFADAARQGGFDVIVGNPPWVRLHRIPPTERAALRAHYEVMRNAAWRAGAAASGAMTGFAMQADLAALFTERAVSLIRPGGVAALLVPAKLLRSLAGGGLRTLLARDTHVLACEDHAAGRALFDAAVYPAVLAVQRRPEGATARREARTASPSDTACAVVRRDTALRWQARMPQIALDASTGAPWLLMPAPVRAAFDALAKSGVPLAESDFGRPMLGVKTGCNDALVVQPEPTWRDAHGSASCKVTGGGRVGTVEREMLRPAIRGEDLAPFAAPGGAHALIWTHDAALRVRRTLPTRAARWLVPWRATLERRTDLTTRDRWWSLFRLDAAVPAWRVVWADLGRAPRATVLSPNDDAVALNSCYVVRAPTEDDADALAAWLNAPLAVAWLAALAEPARGGYLRFLGWTMARLPLPRGWEDARPVLAPVGRAAREGRHVAASDLHAATLRAFRLSAQTVEPLLTWTTP